ncbi:MAG: Ig-like domain-containing protein, partial [Chitinophagales bacterium]
GVTNPTTPIVVSVKANDFDVDGDDLTLPAILGTPSLGGTVTVNPDGTVTYDPTGGTFPDAINVVTFQYVICDTNAAHQPKPLCDTATVHIIINKVDSPTLDPNHPPVATNDYSSTTYGVPVVIVVKGNDSDPDGNPTTNPVVVTGPHAGTATVNPDGTVTYTPDFGPGKGPNANHPDTFTYVICDITSKLPNPLCDTATVVITVPNSVQATNDTTLTGVNQPVVINVKANDWDPELDSFSVIQILGNGGNGTSNVPTLYGNATINANGTITYVPNGSQCNVTDTFRYIIRDTLGALDTATVYVFVDCCSKPLAVDDNVTMMQGDTLYANVITNDIYKSTYPQHVSVNVQPTHGTVTVVNDTTIMYIPNANYCGTDYIEYILSDTCGIDTANLSITVDCNCKTPVAVNNYVFTTPSTLVTTNVVTNDTLFNTTSPHSVTIGSSAHGSATVVGDSIRYTPNAGFIGVDSVPYRLCIVCAGDTLCAQAYLIINVDSICKAPIAKDDTLQMGYVCSRPKAVLINDLNVFGGTLNIVQNPIYGTVTISGDSLVYTPSGVNPNVNDVILYSVTNVCGLTDTGALYVNISNYPCNVHHPLAVNDTAKLCLSSGITLTVDVLANDFDQDNDSIRITFVTTPSHGTATIVAGKIVYTYTTPGFIGKDTFAYSVCDNGTPNLCRDAAVIITIDSCKNNYPVILPPVVYDTTYVDSAIVVCINAPDPDGDVVAITSICDPQNGTISNINGLCFTYTPDAGYVGNDTFCIVVCDNGTPAACDTGLVIITVIPFDTTQFVKANPDVANTPKATPVVINVIGNDTYGPKPGDGFTGDTIKVTQVFPAGHGTTVINPDGTVTYTPDSTFCGVDSFHYEISDNGKPVQKDTATVIVYVCDTPDIIAVDDTASTPQGKPTVINVLNNDIIPANNGVTVTVNCDPNHGTATVNTDGTITYSPTADYFGKDTFCYIVCANIGGNTWICDTAIVVITIPGIQPCFFPNAFSPNGDGLDETFQFPCNYDYPNAVLKVYNRWGDEVWRNVDGGYKNNWDGKNLSGADLPDGTYYYVYQYNDGTNRAEAKFVVIQR